MGKNKYPMEMKMGAMKDFCAGMSLSDIAKKLEVPQFLVTSWYTKFDWRNKRKEVSRRAQSSILEKLTNKLVENADQYLDLSRLGGRIALEKLIEAYRDKGHPGLLDLAEKAMKVGCAGANIQKLVMPQAQEEVMVRAMRELEYLKNIGDGEDAD